MAWPRHKNSRSSAQPGSYPHDGVQATVTPVPDAEPTPGSGHNTGINGATHSVAETPADKSVRHRPRLPPIRYAHSGRDADGSPWTAAPAADTQPAGIVPTSILPASAFPADIEADADADADAGVGVGAGEPADEGLAILGGMATTEVPGDEPRDLRGRPAFGQPQPPAAGTAPSAGDPAGGTRNQRVTSPLQGVGSSRESQPRTFGMKLNALRLAAPADDGQPRASVRDLPPDVQLRFWRLRATIMLIVGVLFGLITRIWEVGLTLAILAGIADTIYRSRNAAYYANGASHPGARKRTRRQLARMRRAGYLTLEARPIPNSQEVIDHLVVGPTGVYAIDSEKWDSKLPIRTLNGKKLYLGPMSMKDRLEHAVWEAQQASDVLSGALGTKIAVQPALAIYGPKVPWDVANIRNVDVFTGGALGKYLKRHGRMRGGVQKLSRAEVRKIYETAAQLLPDVAPTRTVTPVG